jgi:hypothetical protein
MATTREILCYYPRQRGRAVPLQVLQSPHDVALQVSQGQHDVDNFDGVLIGRS